METQERRELEAWLAEHVMGWTRCDNAVDLKPGEFIVVREGEEDLVTIVHDGLFGGLAMFWRPTESSGDAMDVLNRCAQHEQVVVEVDTGGKMAWVWAHSPEKIDCVWLETRADTTQTAVCIFARKLFEILEKAKT